MQKVKTFHPTLFNNFKYIESDKHLNVVIGDFFEEATANLLNLKRLCLDATQDVCPDLVNDTKTLYVESKASNLSSGGVAIKTEQLNYYKDLVDCHFPNTSDPVPIFKIELKYCMWFYDSPKIEYIEVEKVRKHLSECIKFCFVMDLSHILAIGNNNVQCCKRIRLSKLLSYIDTQTFDIDHTFKIKSYEDISKPFQLIKVY